MAMRVGLGIAAFLVFAAAAQAQVSAESKPRELYQALNAVHVSGKEVYLVKDLTLHRDALSISLGSGKLAFFSPCDGRVTGAVFAGDGHVLALVRDPVERLQLNRFLGAPVLDQNFFSAIFRFTDDTADELREQLRAAGTQPSEDSAFAGGWDAVLPRMNPWHSMRILADWLSENPRPYFYAGIQGNTAGSFDVLVDQRRPEQVFIGQTRVVAGQSFYDVWASLERRARGEASAWTPAFLATNYSVDTGIFPDRTLQATAVVTLRVLRGGERIVPLELSRFLHVQAVEDASGNALDFFQNEALAANEIAARGNDSLQVVLPGPARPGEEIRLRLTYAGTVISDAGNGVLFVGARGSWYPHLGGSDTFSQFDLAFRWPRRLRLVATGKKTEEREEGEMHFGRWRSEKPISVAGFNLGDYASETVRDQALTLDVYANRELEQALVNRMERSIAPPASLGGLPSIAPGPLGPRRLEMPEPLPSPMSLLKRLGQEIASAVHFYERYNGPFPFDHLSVSQIPGSFGQGWPGLLYLSTFSFLTPLAQQRAGLNESGQEHFTELVPFHEVAHQWWGNVVGWSSYRDQWIEEGLANYLALLFADSQKAPDRTLNAWLLRYRHRLTQKAADQLETGDEVGPLVLGYRLSSSKSPDGYERVVYGKGAWVFHMIRMMLRQRDPKNPDARFLELLHNLLLKYRYRALSTDDLQREIEAVLPPAMALEGGRSLDWFFDQWVRSTGIPHYKVIYSVHPQDSAYLVRGALHQTGVPDSFLALVPLYAGIEGGKPVYLGTVETSGEQTRFQFVSPRRLHRVLIDPHLTLLCVPE
ncbi:MAG TPA: M1 family aminopeptidase [Candidatus Acidoferrales bacterium]|nr:M1 family aminopeptidase [Candidatus Acidoferrales bacterium]